MEPNLSFKNNYNSLSNEELIKLSQEGNEEIKDYFFERNKPLIYGIIKRFYRNRKDEDLFQIACVGFVKAFNHFDLNYNVKFSTYAVPIIIGEIKKYFRDEGSVHIARSLKENYYRIVNARERLQQIYLCEPTIQMIAEDLSLSEEDVILSLEANQYVSSVDDVIYESEGNDITLLDISKDEKENDIVLKAALEKENAALNEEEKLLLFYRYYKNMKQQEIALKMGISQVQVSRMEKKVLLKLREKFTV